METASWGGSRQQGIGSARETGSAFVQLGASLLPPQPQLVEDRRQRRGLGGRLRLGALRQYQCQLAELLRSAGLAGDLLDHLAVVGGEPEGLGIELDDERGLQIEGGC